MSTTMGGESSDSLFRLYQGDSRNLKDILYEKFKETTDLVDAIITSPPYANVQDYGDHEDQVGDQPYERFLSDLQTVFRQSYEVATDEATLWVITDTYRRNNRLVRLPFDIADELENLQGVTYCQEKGCQGRVERDRGSGMLTCEECGSVHDPLSDSWRLQDHIIWNKQRTRPWHHKGQLRNVYEHVSMYSKSDDFTYNVDAIRIRDPDEFGRWWVDYPERYHPQGKLPDNLWEFPIPKQGRWGPELGYHPSPFPEGLVERIIKLSTNPGDVVLDPFAGVGTALAIAERLDRKPIGIELTEEYVDYYENHVRPKVLNKQATLESGEDTSEINLERLIWTLRIHKFAFRLYRKVITNDEINISNSAISAIFAVTDQEDVNDATPPETDLIFMGEGGGIKKSVIEDVRENLTDESGKSGNYYEVEFNIHTEQMETLIQKIKGGESLISQDGPVYVYPRGNHYWYDVQLSIDQWIEQVEENEWRRFLVTGWAPLVSTLPIRVDNPREERKQSEGIQTQLEKYF